MEKKYFVYYATEENAFETEKNGAYIKEEALKEAKSYLDEYEDESDITDDMEHLEKHMDYGTEVTFPDKWKGYTMLVGIAPKGRCRNVSSIITDLRREYFG